MKITIEPTTDAEKQHGKTMVLDDVRSLGIVAVYHDGDKPREPFRHGVGNLPEVMRELPLLTFALTEAMLVAGAAARAQQAQQRIAIAPPGIDLGNNGPNLRLR